MKNVLELAAANFINRRHLKLLGLFIYLIVFRIFIFKFIYADENGNFDAASIRAFIDTFLNNPTFIYCFCYLILFEMLYHYSNALYKGYLIFGFYRKQIYWYQLVSLLVYSVFFVLLGILSMVLFAAYPDTELIRLKLLNISLMVRLIVVYFMYGMLALTVINLSRNYFSLIIFVLVIILDASLCHYGELNHWHPFIQALFFGNAGEALIMQQELSAGTLIPCLAYLVILLEVNKRIMQNRQYH